MEKLQEKIALEYEEFKKNTLKQRPEEIWDGCCKIYFYSSLFEYFTYNEKILYVVMEKLKEYSSILAGCWELYLKKEELSILSWADIDTLLETFIEKEVIHYENERICGNHQRQDHGKDRGCCGDYHKTGTEE